MRTTLNLDDRAPTRPGTTVRLTIACLVAVLAAGDRMRGRTVWAHAPWWRVYAAVLRRAAR